MDPIYDELISRVEAKIAVLVERIERHRAQISILKQMAIEEEGDPFSTAGIAVARSNEHKPTQAEPDRQNEAPKEPRRVSKPILHLLEYIGVEGKTLDELAKYADMTDLAMSKGAIRAFANTYKRQFDFLSSPRSAFYRLTDRGVNFLDSRTPLASESPAISARGAELSADTGLNEDDNGRAEMRKNAA